MDWLPISEYKAGVTVMRWHKIWKCPIAVTQANIDGQLYPNWIEKTLTTYWPDAAFDPFFADLPKSPIE